MLTFSLNKGSASGGSGDSYAARVLATINANERYFKKFNPVHWEEAMHSAYLVALENQDGRYDNLHPYIKKLARNIMRSRTRDIPFTVFDEGGEISTIFRSLSEIIETTTFDGNSELVGEFKKLYLRNPDSFMKLQHIFNYDDDKHLRKIKEFRSKDKELWQAVRSLVEKFGPEYTFGTLGHFFAELPNLTKPSVEGQIKEILIRPGKLHVLSKLPDMPTIVGEDDGEYHYINPTTLEMSRNPDYFKWDVIGSSMCDIYRIDYSEFMNHVYEEVYVPQGVDTKFIKWCGDFYKLTTPAGESEINMDREKFINRVRVELVANLIARGVGSIIAISPDNLYIKPTRTFNYGIIRIKYRNDGAFDRAFDLPVTLHIKKRK